MLPNDETWLPTYTELRHLATHGTAEQQAYYSQFGWNQLVIPATCTHVSARMTTPLADRFFERYCLRKINQETLPRWQVRLQNRMDEVVQIYERAYTIYEAQASHIASDVLPGTKTTIAHTNQASGSDSNTSTAKTKTADTPDSTINDSDSYADKVVKNTGSGSTTYGRKDTANGTTETESTGAIVLAEINASIRSYVDIDTALMKEFEDCFLNIFDY